MNDKCKLIALSIALSATTSFALSLRPLTIARDDMGPLKPEDVEYRIAKTLRPKVDINIGRSQLSRQLYLASSFDNSKALEEQPRYYDTYVQLKFTAEAQQHIRRLIQKTLECTGLPFTCENESFVITGPNKSKLVLRAMRELRVPYPMPHKNGRRNKASLYDYSEYKLKQPFKAWLKSIQLARYHAIEMPFFDFREWVKNIQSEEACYFAVNMPFFELPSPDSAKPISLRLRALVDKPKHDDFTKPSLEKILAGALDSAITHHAFSVHPEKACDLLNIHINSLIHFILKEPFSTHQGKGIYREIGSIDSLTGTYYHRIKPEEVSAAYPPSIDQEHLEESSLLFRFIMAFCVGGMDH